MKKLIIFISFLLIAFGCASCDPEETINKILEKDITISETVRIPVHVDQTNGDWDTFTNSVPLSIDNNQTHDYLDKIKSVTINSLSYKIVNFVGDNNGEVDAAFSVNNGISLQNAFVVHTEASNSTRFEVTEVAELNRIATQLKNGKTVTTKYSGSALCNNGDMDFEVEVTLSSVIKVGL